MKRKMYFGMASAAVIALVIALNITGTIGKTDSVNAAAKKTVTQTTGTVKADDSTISKTNTVVLADKSQISQPSSVNKEALGESQVKVPVDMEVEKGDQKNADKGSSPWKLDPVFVSQVFVSLKISPQGIQGDYPVKENELKIVKNTDTEAIVAVSSNKTNIKRVYLKKLVRQDKTGIWTVVGYDLAS